MKIERVGSEIVIRVSAETDLAALQTVLDFARFREIASKSKATQDEVDALAKEAKATWWEQNKNRFKQ